MTSLETDNALAGHSSRLLTRIALASFAIMFAAGALMWWRFGPVIFVDMLAALQNCF